MDCIIIEDQIPAQRILKKYIQDIGTLQLKATFFEAVQAIDFLKTEKIDLIFLDIHLPKMSGLDFLKILPHPPHIVLTTAFPDYALESYEFDVTDYLLKPFSFQRFVKAVSKVSSKNITQNTQTETPKLQEIFIKTGHSYVKIAINDIFYIKSDADYTEIQLEEKRYLSSETLRYWTSELEEHSFLQIHKSYIVNPTKVKKMTGNELLLTNNTSLTIGRTFKKDVRQKILEELGQSL